MKKRKMASPVLNSNNRHFRTALESKRFPASNLRICLRNTAVRNTQYRKKVKVMRKMMMNLKKGMCLEYWLINT
jgi:hypothetical protein